MSDWKNYNNFYIYIRGKPVVNNKISINQLGLILRRFQDLYNHTSRIISPTLEREDFILYFSKVEAGKSVYLEVIHAEATPTLTTEYLKPDQFFIKIFDSVLEEDFTLGLKKFKDLISSPISRIEILNKLEKFWSTKSRKMELGFGKSIKTANYRRLIRTYKQRIRIWKKREEEELKKEIRGFITRAKFDTPATFTVVDEEGNKISGKIRLNILKDIKKFTTRLVRIKGVIKKKGKFYRFLKVNSINLDEKIKFENYVGDIKLNFPLIFTASWFEDGIIVEEKELELSFFIKNLKELDETLEDYLNILREEYMEESDEKLEVNAKRFKKKLIDLLE